MHARWLALGVILCSWSIALAGDSGLQKQLTDQYRDQIFILRHPFQSDFQQYDANGTLRNYFPEGAWTLYGRIAVKEITLDDKELRLTGLRVFYRFEKHQGRLVPALSAEQVRIRVQLSSPINSASDASPVLARVFASSREDVLLSAPPYWRPYLAKQMSDGSVPQGDGKNPPPLPDHTPAADNKPEGEKVFHLGDPGVVRPKAQLTPEPNFTEVARKARFQGTMTLDVVVDKTGSVSDIQIVTPLGMGLDDNAASTIRKWRFAPATRNEEPVSVAFSVEINFQLYDNQP